MIDIFEALSWLNAIDHCFYLTIEDRQLIDAAGKFDSPDSSVRIILERLRTAAHSPGAPLRKAEILLNCAAIRHWRAWYPQAALDAREAVIVCDTDDHRHAVALWMLGMAQWEMFQNHDAYRNWAEAKKIFEECQSFLQHFPGDGAWYQGWTRQMNVDLVARPEEIWTWLNWFEPSCLRPQTQEVVDCVQKKIRQRAYANVYVLMQDLQEANRRCEGVYEQAEVYLEFGLAIYQMGNTHFAIELLRKSVQNFYPGIGTYHKQMVARCLLGAVEWMNERSQDQAVADWTGSIEEIENLRQIARRDNDPSKGEWYAEHHHILHTALTERLNGRKASRRQTPFSSDPSSNSPDGNNPRPPSTTPQPGATDPYRELLIKVRWDRAIADRLIEFERKKAPTADRNELIRRAIERWLRDNQ